MYLVVTTHGEWGKMDLVSQEPLDTLAEADHEAAEARGKDGELPDAHVFVLLTPSLRAFLQGSQEDLP